MMQTKRQHKFIAFLLVVALLMSGMCIEKDSFEKISIDNLYADSVLLSRNLSHDESTSIDATDSSLISSVACTDELISTRTVTNVLQRYKRTGAKIFSKADFGLSIVELLPQLTNLSIITIAATIPSDNISNTVIIGFIHHKDGKKA